MQWIKGHIYKYHGVMDTYSSNGKNSSQHHFRNSTVTKNTLDAQFILLDYTESFNESIHIFVISSTGVGRLYDKWRKEQSTWFEIDNRIGYTDITDQFSEEGIEYIKQLYKLVIL